MKRYRVLRRTALIAPDRVSSQRGVCAASDTVVALMDQSGLFRDKESPITKRPDELLVRWEKEGKPELGWLARDAVMKESKGPLGTIEGERDELAPWDQLRARIYRADRKMLRGRRWDVVTWLAAFGEKHLDIVRLAIREFGGKPKGDDADTLSAHLLRLILKTEIDMKTARKNSKKSSVKSNNNHVAKKSAKKGSKKRSNGGGHGRTSQFSGYTIKKLQKENPRREGTLAGKSWDLIKSGMTYDEFMDKGGRYASLLTEIAKKRVKMIAPKK